ncbi:LacI family DNA-binding transcriptional regulator [Kordiimonas aestuarii]|uniref:LacI family DNA-binding transcriptional regulator n=1 Tax=Kordiimonas aestuarii TaxID=1005925 RepID=UPI0021CFFE45|nr:LacI family DNA-binding transcriptional regulator [Kordiimonas aestuarii]
MRSVTIDDVAKKAGVSIKTVSRVVNREPNVRAATKEKVELAIKELNYRPNQSARGLAARRSYMIGLLYDNPSPNYLANLQSGVLEACHEKDYGLALNPVSFHDPDLIDTVVHWVRQSFIDGVVVTPPLTDSVPLLNALHAENIPAVVISSRGTGDAPAALIDEEAAAYEMTRHLIGEGHSRIAFIKGHPDHYASGLREKGYYRALREENLAVVPDYVQQGFFDFASGQKAASKLFDLRDRPTAIFASNDDMAAAVIFEAHSRKIEVPRDLAVAGFDDTPLSRQIWPGLTTVRQPIRSMGHQAADVLIDTLSAGKDAGKERRDLTQFDFELKLRGSTARA